MDPRCMFPLSKTLRKNLVSLQYIYTSIFTLFKRKNPTSTGLSFHNTKKKRTYIYTVYFFFKKKTFEKKHTVTLKMENKKLCKFYTVILLAMKLCLQNTQRGLL